MTDDQIRVYSHLRVKLTGDVRLASWVDEIGSVYVAATFPEIRLRCTIVRCPAVVAADPERARRFATSAALRIRIRVATCRAAEALQRIGRTLAVKGASER